MLLWTLADPEMRSIKSSESKVNSSKTQVLIDSWGRTLKSEERQKYKVDSRLIVAKM